MAHDQAAARRFAAAPPLALYMHMPWCVRKCPYCDFNSHAVDGPLPEAAYIDALLRDAGADLARHPAPAPLVSVFIGGGTPSLFTGAAIARLLAGLRALGLLGPDTEVTLEANPGSADALHFEGYRAAGVNRLSIGVQSFDAAALTRLGRIHDPAAARTAIAVARGADFDNINLDLMYGLPDQTLEDALGDLDAALAVAPAHLSWYQLTLEPNTAFAAAAPVLPDGDLLADMEEQGQERLAAAGYARYEISAYARPGRRCRHNLNYWQFGDYLGIGAGAHGKRSEPATGQVERRARWRSPRAYLDAADTTSSVQHLTDADLVLEFALNACRLVDGFSLDTFERHTGLPRERLAAPIAGAIADALLHAPGPAAPDLIRPTPLGLRFANVLIARFGE